MIVRSILRIVLTSVLGIVCGIVSWFFLESAVDQWINASTLRDMYWFFFMLALPMLSVIYSSIFFLFAFWKSTLIKERLMRLFIFLNVQVLVAVASVIIFILFILWGDVCNDDVMARAHLFNGHIKALCLERDDGECPKDIKELAAFNPKVFVELKKKAKVEYQRSSSLGYTFKVNYCGGSTLEFSESYPDGRHEY